MEELLNLVRAIPDSLWGVIVGSTFTLLGITLTNAAAGRRLAAQFKHERGLRGDEREHAMYRDTFLAAADAITDRVTTIMRFPDPSIADKDLTADPAGKSSAIIKAELIADDDLRRSLSELSTRLADVWLRMMLKRMPLNVLQYAVADLNKRETEATQKYQQALELMRQGNLNGNNDQKYWTALRLDFESSMNQAKEIAAERDAKQLELYRLQADLLEECAVEAAKLNDVGIRIIIQMRRVLKLPTDEAEMQKTAAAAVVQRTENFRKFIAEARKQILAGAAQPAPEAAGQIAEPQNK